MRLRPGRSATENTATSATHKPFNAECFPGGPPSDFLDDKNLNMGCAAVYVPLSVPTLILFSGLVSRGCEEHQCPTRARSEAAATALFQCQHGIARRYKTYSSVTRCSLKIGAIVRRDAR